MKSASYATNRNLVKVIFTYCSAGDGKSQKTKHGAMQRSKVIEAYWTTDRGRTKGPIYMVCCPSFRLSISFLGIGFLLVFSET